jgi:RHS repeat-associated protein
MSPGGCASHVSRCALRFTGKERDAESGNDYFKARHFGSSMGRFLSPDPLAWLDWQHGKEEEQQKFVDFISNPQHLNMYAYVLNNPLRFTDPDGLLEYIAKILGKDVKVHIDDNLAAKEQGKLKGRLDAAIGNINGHAGDLTSQQKSVLGNIKSIDVSGSLARSYVNESGGDFHLTVGYVKGGSTAWLGSAIGHDGFHVEEFKQGGISNSRGVNAEKRAFQFQLGLGQRIGFTDNGSNYLKGLIPNPAQLSQYYNSPVQ